jgi:PTH1 family peptidyl-tRNA hydrolase
MKLIVGLGNPGCRYEATRHNVGWRVADTLAARGGAAAWREKFDAALAEVVLAGQKVALVRPMTYMNLSGIAVRQAMDFWKLGPADVLVLMDDLALEVGRLRVRAAGSAGGHNGLASVLQHLGTDAVTRVRVGIGAAPSPEEGADYVLAPFTPAEQPVIEEALERAADAAECWVAKGTEATMNRFNRAEQD